MKIKLFFSLVIALFTLSPSRAIDGLDHDKVIIKEEKMVLPTYLVDPPDLNPRFYEGRAYQGAQGRIYPYPIYESLSDKRIDKEYTMVLLENEYIRIEVLPEIGGRLFGAIDKTNGYTYIYRQHVIKPGLIGMLGAWISGGIEWNFPHHHRANAFMPVEYELRENEDGSATLWIGELEIRHRMRFTMGITVFPGKSYFEVTFNPLNGTPLAHSFLYFANTGVHTNEDYQVIFPPNTQYGTYHGKNQFISWPISHEVYNRVDYTEGVDVSWWKNHPEWTSIFAWNYEDDFIAGYDHGKEAGTLLYSNHNIGPGKKFWTWSTGPRGKLWDEALTETDGPELELMIGGFSDNQPDYSWMQPFESKLIRQYWYPIRNLGGVKNANLNAAMNIEFPDQNKMSLALNTTSKIQEAKLRVAIIDNIIYERMIDIDPANPFQTMLDIPDSYEGHDIKISLISKNGDTIIDYKPKKQENMEMPDVARPPKRPESIQTVEELYLAGMRLEQFYNPSLDPMPYYQEALKMDPDNYRINIAVGINYLKRGLLDEAEEIFQIAVDRITSNHTKPRDGEGYYYLGLTQKYQGKLKEAYTNLYQATWSYAFHSAAYYLLAEIECNWGNYNEAIEHLERSISTNSENTKALNLMTVALRKLKKTEAAISLNEQVRKKFPLNFWSIHESILLGEIPDNKKSSFSTAGDLKALMGDYVENYLELSLDYGNCGLWEEASGVLKLILASEEDAGVGYPMIFYYLAWHSFNQNQPEDVARYLKLAGEMPIDYCFPFRIESKSVLEFAIENNPKDANAYYFMGNLLFEWEPTKARIAWEKATDMRNDNPIAFRNLGLAYHKEGGQSEKALKAYAQAVELKGSDQRLLYEQDLIMAENRVDPYTRLKILQDHHEAISSNNVSDALSREVMLLVQVGNYDTALKVLGENYFRQWEGVSKAYGSYVDAHLLMGVDLLKRNDFDKALDHFNMALEYPDNMMVAESYRGGREAEVYYYIGRAYQLMKKKKKAEQAYQMSAGRRLNEELSDIYFFRAMSLKNLGDSRSAENIFQGLIELGENRLESKEVDFFAKFGEKETPEDKAANAWHLIGLGYLGMEEPDQARKAFEKAVDLNINHVWARFHMQEYLKY